MKDPLRAAVSAFGASAKKKLSNPSVVGAPEDQLRTPFEKLLFELGAICEIPSKELVAVGESTLKELKTRPDYAVTVGNALVGFIELKAPGKGADPTKFKDPHDKEQWIRFKSLPNLIYTDGNDFSLWHSGEAVMPVVRLDGNIESSGDKLKAPAELAKLFQLFFGWQPIAPKSAKELAHVTARLCRLLRDEVTEQLELKSEALTELAKDWRKLLFPDATDERFADGYAQAVTFGMLMARAKKISLTTSLHKVSEELSKTSTLIGAALRLLTDNVETQETLKTALSTLTRVLDSVDWKKISGGHAEAWLYFYEDFLAVYDNDLRKQTGSYYTPAEVVQSMISLVDEVLRTSRFKLHQGLASTSVTLADPAVGTGTFILAALRRIATTVREDEGDGAVSGSIQDALKRLIAFEMQLGPFSVAQLRIAAEILDLTGSVPKSNIRMYVTNTLGNPYDDEEWIPGILAPIGKSRKEANKIKREEAITVVIGNPPYKEKALGYGGWVETATKNAKEPAPLHDWMPPRDWGVGAHAKHLRNLYVYFWRWATWKVFDHGPGSKCGVVCFITVAGFLNGPGFEKMRDYLRRTCDDIWVIDCSPEGFQPVVPTRIFQAVQQPVCIVLASRSPKGTSETGIPANVLFRSLHLGKREDKFLELATIRLQDSGWTSCPSEWRAPFLPVSKGAWKSYPALEDLFCYDGSGVMPGRTWVISPDAGSLVRRWETLTHAPKDAKESLFHPHIRGGKPGDRHAKKSMPRGLPGFAARSQSVADDSGNCVQPVRYAYRSFDRQWIIPDNRLINQPNPELWETWSEHQIYITALKRASPRSGPALSVTGLIPDLDHYKGSFGGRVYPLWSDSAATVSNFRPGLFKFLSAKYGYSVTPEDLFSYIAAVTAHPAYTKRFQVDLSTPGLHVPITADGKLFRRAAEVGRTVVWLHCFGERMVDATHDRPAGPPRMRPEKAPKSPAAGAIPDEAGKMPDEITFDPAKRRLTVGGGFIDNVDERVWSYEICGKRVLTQWFSYRKANRERPIIGDRRKPSPLGDIQPDHWLPEYTSELINVLNVLGRLVDLEESQQELLENICAGPLLTEGDLRTGGALELPPKKKTSDLHKMMTDLFE